MTLYSIDVDDFLHKEDIKISLNQKDKILCISSGSKSDNRVVKINSLKDKVVYSGTFLNQQKKIKLIGFNKGIYSLEVISTNNSIVKEFAIK